MTRSSPVLAARQKAQDMEYRRRYNAKLKAAGLTTKGRLTVSV